MADLLTDTSNNPPRGLSDETFALLMELAPAVQDFAPDFLEDQVGLGPTDSEAPSPSPPFPAPTYTTAPPRFS